MANRIHAFGIYENEYDAEVAVDQLVTAGFDAAAIRVLHPDNDASRDFVDRKGTTLPAGIGEKSSSGVPLDGSWGLLYPGEGPIQGALPDALTDMGIPHEWSDNTVRDGKFLLSVECLVPDTLLFATAILRDTGATETSTSETQLPEPRRPGLLLVPA